MRSYTHAQVDDHPPGTKEQADGILQRKKQRADPDDEPGDQPRDRRGDEALAFEGFALLVEGRHGGERFDWF